MPHHQHHQHAPRAAQVVETVVNVVYVTAGASEPTSKADSVAATQSSRQNGSPLQNTRQQEPDTFPTQVNSYPTFAMTSETYNQPASRQQRPEPRSSSSVVLEWSGNAALAPSSASAATSRNARPPMQPQHTTMVPMVSSSFLAASSATGLATSFNLAAPLASSTSAASSPEKTDNGMSGGAKAGIAFGVIIGLALIAGIAFFLYRRKKSQNDDHQRLDDEKTDLPRRSQSVTSHTPITQSRTNAPRLSLKPVAQMFPPQMSEKSEASTFAAGSVAAAAAGVPRSKTPEPATENPFGDHAEDKSVIATPATAATATPVTAKLDQVSQPTPVVQGQAFPGAPAGSRRNSPPGPGPNNVHRVQLDFNPSMDDELSLKAGSLVRLLHEYDDGWALCIRLDRSQQGVVPRTCVSKLPVKPRPGPPPGSRPRGPSNAPGPRTGPPAARPTPPAGVRIRAQSNAPGSGRQSPGPFQGPAQGRARSNSDAMSARRITPPSPMNPTGSVPSSPPQAQGQMPARKPVPGQAI